MNNRFKELLDQCWDERLDGRHIDQEKFAELIVREFIVDFYRNHLDTTSNEDITVQVERFVRDRFGVEE